jgi:hypothetical protein
MDGIRFTYRVTTTGRRGLLHHDGRSSTALAKPNSSNSPGEPTLDRLRQP